MSNADDKWLETLRSKVESAPAELPEGGAEALCAGVARLQRRRRLARSFVALGSAAAAALAFFLLLPGTASDSPLTARNEDSTKMEVVTELSDNEISEVKISKSEALVAKHSTAIEPAVPVEKLATGSADILTDKPSDKPTDKPSEKPSSKPDTQPDTQPDMTGLLAMDDQVFEPEAIECQSIRRFSAGLQLAMDGSMPGNMTSYAASASAVSIASDRFGEPRAASSLFKGYHSEYEHFKPLNLGVNLSIGLSDRLSLETGVIYSYHKSHKHNYLNSVELGYDDQTLHFVGVPLGLRLTAFEAGRSSLYGYAGVMTLKCAYATWNGNKLTVSPIVLSANLSAGYQFAISNYLGIYFESGLSYFDAGSDFGYTIYSQNPWQFELRGGFRFSI